MQRLLSFLLPLLVGLGSASAAEAVSPADHLFPDLHVANGEPRWPSRINNPWSVPVPAR